MGPELQAKAELAKYYLKGFPVAIAETHTKTHGRELAHALLASGYVKQFFVEIGTNDNDQASFGYFASSNMSVFDEYKDAYEAGNETPALTASVESVFGNLMPTDANPNLLDLTLTALQHGVEVIPADDLIRKGAGMGNLAIRNESIARWIGNYAKNWGSGALLMWGANHFHKNGDSIQEHLINQKAQFNRPIIFDVSRM